MLLTQFLTLLLSSALIGLFCVVYRNILSYEAVLNWWFVFGARFEDRWFYKPIWGCALCISGQFALWTYVLNVLSIVISYKIPLVSNVILFIVPNYHLNSFSVLEGLIFITQTIFITYLLNAIYFKLEKWIEKN